jgi:hypothetical protein
MEDIQKRACLEFNQVDPVIDAVAGQETPYKVHFPGEELRLAHQSIQNPI